MVALSAAVIEAQTQQPAAQGTPAAESDVIKMGAVVVTGIRETLADALAREKESMNLKSVLSANEIGALPDTNVADALSRLPGVSVSTSGGEARFVTIRGVEPGLNNVTMNGETLAASDTSGRAGRAAPLDVLSAASIGHLEVIKTVTPDMDGQSIGGTINILTPSAFDRDRQVFYGSAEWRINDLYAKGDNYAWEANYSNQFGRTRNWGLFLATNGSFRDYKINEIEARYADPGPAGELTPDRIQPVAQRGSIRRNGATANLEYRGSNDRRFYVRGYYTKNDERYHRVQDQINFKGPYTNRTALAGTAKANLTSIANNDEPVRKVSQVVAGGETPLGESLRLEASLTYSKATEDWPLRDSLNFDYGSSLPIDYDWSDPYFPRFNLGSGPGNLPTDLGGWSFSRMSHESSSVLEETKTGRVDLTWTRDIGGRPAKLKFGFKGTDRTKSVDDYVERYVPTKPAPTYALASAATGGATIGTNFSGYQNYGTFLDGRYDFGAIANIEAATAYFNATRPPWMGFVQNGNAYWNLNLKATINATTEDDYHLREKIAAGYAMGEIQLNPKLKAIGGVRVERTKADIDSVVNDQQKLTISPISGGTTFTNVLPNLQFRYEARKNLLFRGSATWTISRPDYVDLSPNSVLKYETTSSGLDGSLSIGNPNLKPYEAVNFDASVDYYLPHSGVISAGVFHKRIKNAIYGYGDLLKNVEFDGFSFVSLSRSTVRNAAPGHITGLELTYQQNFVFLPAPFDGFGVVVNGLIASSSVRAFERTDEVPFFGQADRVANLQLYYQKSGFEVRLGYHYQGPSLLTIGPDKNFDVYYAARKQYDLQARYRISDQWNVYFQVNNLTNEPARDYTGRPGLLAFTEGPANEYSGITYTFGVGWSY